MEKAIQFPQSAGRQTARRGQLPRSVICLALLIALAVAGAGAAMTRTTPLNSPGATRS